MHFLTQWLKIAYRYSRPIDQQIAFKTLRADWKTLLSLLLKTVRMR